MTSTDGLVIVDKESAVTSHQVVGRLRRLLGIRKVGHAGTLDPMATGVLILGVGRATRLLGHLALHDKRYLATVRLGARSDTDDADGTVVPVADASGITEAELAAACAPLRGVISQVPSAVSAIKVGGKRAYALARAGEEVKLAPREVTVSRLDVLAVRPTGSWLDIDIDVECSSGTYIRAIARDLGLALGVGGHLRALRRTRVGGFDLGDAVRLGEEAPRLMSMAEAARRSFSVVELSPEQAREVRFGRALPLRLGAQLTGLISPEGRLLALYRAEGERAVPVTVFVGSNDQDEECW
ncbi:tRNA pseudouridine(55) synthase TruB [Tessaracoccus sp. OH4464_COT-324]|uniref:tRNA pseudouridine(55) synthase TruB n=1 Tax=Tessaracoccus sp. OH4464_COT-324 TaxID=2491059 RepID=UPI000F63B4A9|nr:tRNA pseudouridine(55) synthase TruB [Tessaracoccus sp. OH4464_COT-324]RRD47756.1 tRNA pseudouridine(55) synthase TruB [Tessaracoccus sp. OH4464_COT-324]